MVETVLLHEYPFPSTLHLTVAGTWPGGPKARAIWTSLQASPGQTVKPFVMSSFYRRQEDLWTLVAYALQSQIVAGLHGVVQFSAIVVGFGNRWRPG